MSGDQKYWKDETVIQINNITTLIRQQAEEAEKSIVEKMGANVFALPGSQEVLQPGWFSMKKIPEHCEPGHQSGACGKCNSKD